VRDAPTDPTALRTLIDVARDTDQLWLPDEPLAKARRLAPRDRTVRALSEEFERHKRARLEGRIAERRAARNGTDDLAADIAVAEDLASLGRLREAADEYARLARAHPERRDLRLQEARLRSWNGDHRAALALYDALIAEDPRDHVARVERARVLAWDGQLAAANAAVPPLAELDGTRPSAESVLGDVHRWDGAVARAAGFYQDALAGGLDGDAAADAHSFLSDNQRYTQVGPWGEDFSASDDFHARRFGAELTRQATFSTRLAARVHQANYSQDGEDLSARRAALTLTHERGIVHFLGRAGIGSFSSGDVTPAFGLGAEIRRRPEEAIGVGFDRFDLIDEVMSLRSALGDVLQANRMSAWLRYPLRWRLRLAATASFDSISDGNQAMGASLVLGRRMLRKPRLELRVDGRYYSVSELSPRYWSPAPYISTGLGVELEHQLRRGIRVLLDGRGGLAREESSQVPELGFGARLAFDMFAGWELNVGYRFAHTARSTGGSDGYDATTAIFELRYRLGTYGMI
jgi:tetratricopeptide (TPR) repeat protein